MSLRNDDGAVGILFAIMMPTFLGFLALGLDVALLYQSRMQIQLSADSGALAAASKLPDQDAARALALRLANENAGAGGTVTTAADVVFGVYDANTKVFTPVTGTSTVPNAVRVKAFRDDAHGNTVQTFFTKLIGNQAAFASQAQATATKAGSDACMYLLDKGNAFASSGVMTLNVGCGVQINSTMAVSGTSTVNVADNKLVSVAGSVAGTLTVSPASALKTQQPVLADPLASLVEPVPVGLPPCSPVILSGTQSITLQPNCLYTTDVVVSGTGTTTLMPGTYLFKGASIVMSGSHTIKGTGVTLYFDKDSGIAMSGTNTIDLSAPATGPLQGIVLFQSRSAAKDLAFSGETVLKFNGTVYMPSSSLIMSGTATTRSRIGSMVLKSIAVSGTQMFNVGTPIPGELRPKELSYRGVKLAM